MEVIQSQNCHKNPFPFSNTFGLLDNQPQQEGSHFSCKSPKKDQYSNHIQATVTGEKAKQNKHTDTDGNQLNSTFYHTNQLNNSDIHNKITTSGVGAMMRVQILISKDSVYSFNSNILTLARSSSQRTDTKQQSNSKKNPRNSKYNLWLSLNLKW